MENNTINNQVANNEINEQSVPMPESQVHLETLVTPTYAITVPPKEIMEVLDGMINMYIEDTKCTLINVVQFGFDEVDEENIRGFARIAVQRPTVNWIMDIIKNAPDDVQEKIAEMAQDALSQTSDKQTDSNTEGTANGNS